MTATSEKAIEKKVTRSYLVFVLLFGLAYLACAAAGRLISFPVLPFVSFWLPSGLFVGVLLRNESRRWPLLVTAALLANIAFDLINGQPLKVALCFATGNSLEALIGASLVRRFVGRHPTLSSIKEVGGLFVFSALLSPVVGATIGCVTIMSFLGGSSLGTLWLFWWSGDMLGILLIAPLMITWPSKSRFWSITRLPVAMNIEMALLLLMTCAVTIFCLDNTFHPDLGLKYLVIPCVLWASLRFDLRATALVSIIVAVLATWLTARGYGDIAASRLSAQGQMATLQLFLVIVALTGLSLSSVMNERMKAKDALTESESKFATAFREAPVWIAITDLQDGTYVDVNDRALDGSGFLRDEVIGHTAVGVGWLVPEDRKRLVQSIKDHGRINDMEMTFRAKSGRLIQGLVYGEQIMIAGRACLLTATIDITARRKIEESLRTSEAQLKNAQRIAQLGNWETDLVNNTIVWSDEVYRIFEIDSERFKGTYEAFLATVHPDDREALDAAFKQSIEKRMPFEMEHRLLMPDGRVKHVLEVCETFFSPEGKPIRSVGTVQDVTDRKQLEEQLRQAQKLEAIGQLAGGVAHDFNNILAAMMLQLDFLSGNEELGITTLDGLRDLKSQTKRASGLTRQLLAFSRRSVLEIRTLNLDEVVTNLLKMLGRLLGENITLVFDGKSAPPLVDADAGMMEQVLINLSVNARDAMPRGGQITISTEIVEIDETRAAARPERRAGRFVCMSVSDTGSGMDPVTLSRVFEPFFTTKDIGKGTGLGLATVYGIVSQHKGWSEVESQVGFGTVFRIYLPLSSKSTPVETEQESSELLKGTETLLIVEDDASVRSALGKTLCAMGYKAIIASSGQEAMSLWREHQQEIDLLFTDMVMPDDMTGLELAEKLLAVKPSLKVIISSGYSFEIAQADGAVPDSIVFLSKPYQVSDLTKVLRSCLENISVAIPPKAGKNVSHHDY